MPTDFPKILKPGPRFRNDDVSSDTEMEYFRPFCEIFWKHGLSQTHAVTLRGLCNYKRRYKGSYCVYEGRPTLSRLDNDEIIELSKPYPISKRKDLIAFLNDSPDEIALHGRHHLHYSQMDWESQFAEMQAGLEELQELFPAKKIRFFVPPFNEFDRGTLKAANRLGLRVLGAEGAHLEEELPDLSLYPGIWYRYHHHRFYPGTTFDTLDLSLEKLDAALAKGMANYCRGRLPMPSFDYEGDVKALADFIRRYGAQEWYLGTALNRRDRQELALAMGWIYAHVEYEQSIFEVGCGAGNNLLWLARHGYEKLGGSDLEPRALAVAREVAALDGFSWDLREDDLLNPARLPDKTDVILAINCVYYHSGFNLASFLEACVGKLSPEGYVVIDQIDESFNGHPLEAVHSSQWSLPPKERTKPGEYRQRIGKAEVEAIAERLGLKLLAALPSFQQIPRVLYVLGNRAAPKKARRPLPALKPPPADIEPTITAIFNSGLFDWSWYREQYVRGPEIMNPLEHFVRFGASQGRWPNPHFDAEAYRRENMQLADPANPLLHWLQQRGAAEMDKNRERRFSAAD